MNGKILMHTPEGFIYTIRCPHCGKDRLGDIKVTNIPNAGEDLPSEKFFELDPMHSTLILTGPRTQTIGLIRATLKHFVDEDSKFKWANPHDLGGIYTNKYQERRVAGLSDDEEYDLHKEAIRASMLVIDLSPATSSNKYPDMFAYFYRERKNWGGDTWYFVPEDVNEYQLQKYPGEIQEFLAQFPIINIRDFVGASKLPPKPQYTWKGFQVGFDKGHKGHKGQTKLKDVGSDLPVMSTVPTQNALTPTSQLFDANTTIIPPPVASSPEPEVDDDKPLSKMTKAEREQFNRAQAKKAKPQ